MEMNNSEIQISENVTHEHEDICKALSIEVADIHNAEMKDIAEKEMLL